MLTTRLAGHPAVGWGSGDPLVVVPGLNDPLCRVGDAGWFSAVVAAYCRRCARAFDRRVYYVSRPRGLSAGTTVGEMAAGYAGVLDAVGPADVLGLSTGGFVAEQLALADGRVRSLVFGLAASRLSAAGRSRVRRWLRWAEAGAWRRVYRGGVDVVFEGPLALAGRGAVRLYARLEPAPDAPGDFAISARASLDYDCERSVEVPTLVVGGTEDPFFSVAGFAETAGRHGGRYRRVEGAGHEAVVHDACRFDGAIATFLSAE